MGIWGSTTGWMDGCDNLRFTYWAQMRRVERLTERVIRAVGEMKNCRYTRIYNCQPNGPQSASDTIGVGGQVMRFMGSRGTHTLGTSGLDSMMLVVMTSGSHDLDPVSCRRKS